MELLPASMMHEILMYLSVSDLYQNCTLVNKDWYAKAYTKYVLNCAVARELHLPKFTAPTEDCISILSQNHAKAKPSSSYVPFLGIGTTGGVYSMNYWVNNMFAPSSGTYCSGSKDDKSMDNIVVMAILECITPRVLNQALITAQKRGAEILQNCSILEEIIFYTRVAHSEFTKPTLTSTTKSMFLEFATTQPEMLINQNSETPHQEQIDEIQQIASTLEIGDSAIQDVKRYPKNDQILFDSQKESKGSSEAMCLHGLYLEYAAFCTCPLKAFVIFLSMEPVDIEDEYFNHFNDVKTRENLAEATLANPDVIPEYADVQSSDEYEMVEFRNKPGKVVPVVWGVFLTPDTHKIDICLQQRFVGRYVYVKLIDRHNLIHTPNPNIDSGWFGFRGNVILIN